MLTKKTVYNLIKYQTLFAPCVGTDLRFKILFEDQTKYYKRRLKKKIYIYIYITKEDYM